jgi:hypothetical protein
MFRNTGIIFEHFFKCFETLLKIFRNTFEMFEHFFLNVPEQFWRYSEILLKCSRTVFEMFTNKLTFRNKSPWNEKHVKEKPMNFWNVKNVLDQFWTRISQKKKKTFQPVRSLKSLRISLMGRPPVRSLRRRAAGLCFCDDSFSNRRMRCVDSASHHRHLDPPVHVDARKSAGGSQSLTHGGVGQWSWLAQVVKNANHFLSLQVSCMHGKLGELKVNPLMQPVGRTCRHRVRSLCCGPVHRQVLELIAVAYDGPRS